MNQTALQRANEDLGQKPPAKSRRLIWIIIGIIVTVVVIALTLIFVLRRNGSLTYPYIFKPRSTMASSSAQELLVNILTDANDSGVEYSVVARQDLRR